MIGMGLKKYAKENGMNIDSGVAYGALKGYAVTMSEGMGYKRMVITTRFVDPAQQDVLIEMLNQHDLMKEYRVQNIQFMEDVVDIIFYDNPGTMPKLKAFVEWFFPMLPAHTATDVNTCVQCGGSLDGAGTWKLVGDVAFHLHSGCVTSMQNEIQAEEMKQESANTGSYGAGLIGALLGALLGAVLWAVVLALGYMASVVGFVIGWLAEKGYEMFHGKRGKGKIVILIIAVILGVVVGTLGGDAVEMVRLINAGEMPGVTYKDIPMWFVALFVTDPEYVSIFFMNAGLGLVFAFLGVFGILRRNKAEVSKTQIRNLK